jgi:hypothetical protein
MEKVFISETTIDDTKQIYEPDVTHHSGKDLSVPIAGSWTTIPKLIEQSYFITSIKQLHGKTTRWKITLNQYDVVT